MRPRARRCAPSVARRRRAIRAKVYAMALSPDGKWLAAGGYLPGTNLPARAIRLYDFATGKLTALLEGASERHHEPRLFARWPPSDFGELRQKPPSSGMWPQGWTEHRLQGHRDHIYAVGFTPDGARAVTGSDDHDLRLWSVADGALLATMTGHGDKVHALPWRRTAASPRGMWSGEIRLWDGQTGMFLKTLARQETEVGNLSFSPDGKRLLSGIGQWGWRRRLPRLRHRQRPRDRHLSRP